MIYVILICSIIIGYIIDEKFDKLEKKIEKLEECFDDKHSDLDYRIFDLEMEIKRDSDKE